MDLVKRHSMSHRRRLEGLLSLVLVLLVLSLVLDVPGLAAAAAVVAFIALASTAGSTLLSAAWWGLTGLVGRLVSGLILALIFFLVVTPVGLLRRLLGKGPAALRPLPAGREPALEKREHVYGPQDFEHPW